MSIFTAPWPGPGNSDGPVDPDGWQITDLPPPDEPSPSNVEEPTLVVHTPWPGPGDSDGSVAG
jgi:hypothetical protein